MRHAIEEEEKIPLEQVTNFNEVCWLFFLFFFLSLACFFEELAEHFQLEGMKHFWYFLRFVMRSKTS